MRETEQTVLVLQGGGALGAFQAGAFQGLFERKVAIDWVAGISIGAINAAIICGNVPIIDTLLEGSGERRWIMSKN